MKLICDIQKTKKVKKPTKNQQKSTPKNLNKHHNHPNQQIDLRE